MAKRERGERDREINLGFFCRYNDWAVRFKHQECADFSKQRWCSSNGEVAYVFFDQALLKKEREDSHNVLLKRESGETLECLRKRGNAVGMTKKQEECPKHSERTVNE
ncbi:hypothetical protein L2E82_08473 [Cichorium intybus]|uniref:Uncharacterized protein n=1 Tax=Cichorium intybus TaxID=13427 RepID=A0ACB9G5X2_CICIN|nr:hypothetical protein L2E82_08473 [Cichorium intybus]